MNAEMNTETNAGGRALEVFDAEQGASVPCTVLYPARAAEHVEHFGPYPLAVARDAPIDGRELQIVLISHGTGGTPWTHRDLAARLARDGFVVVLVEHPGNSRSGDSLAGTAVNLENRPRHLRLALDALLASEAFAPHVARGSAAVIGHSLGGYTGLAAAGGQPSCFAHETPDGQPRRLAVARDPRIRALVLLAPATPWLMGEGALAQVDVPILMRTGEHDVHGSPFHAEIVLRGVPDRARVDHRVIANAGHFSFQSPFPPAMTRPEFPPSQDPPGFDRAAYQLELQAEVSAFLRAALGGAARGR
jgi:predicted dienelactone hydrolase